MSNSKIVATVANLADSHVLVMSATAELFHLFEEAVAGTSAEILLEPKVAELDAKIAADPFMNESLKNHWAAFTKDIQSYYATFGADVVRKAVLGSYEQDKVRTFAKSMAASAFTKVRNFAQQFLLNAIEGGAPNPKPAERWQSTH